MAANSHFIVMCRQAKKRLHLINTFLPPHYKSKKVREHVCERLKRGGGGGVLLGPCKHWGV